MKKLLLALVLSAALFSQTDTHVKNLEAKKVPATKVVVSAKQVETPAPVQPEPQPTQGCESYLPLIKQYQWDVRTAYAIMQAENTTCNPTTDNAGINWNGSVDYGLFQVNSIHQDMVGGNLESLRDPQTNVAVAYRIYAGSGWTAWSTFNSGKYLAHL